MQRQPRTPQEAGMLDPMGLLAMPAPNIPRGIFGSSRRRAGGRAAMSPPDPATPTATIAAPPLSEAPPPPADWKDILGPALVAQLPQPGSVPQTAAPVGIPPTIGGVLGAGSKIANRGAPLPMDATSNGKKGFDWRMLAGIVGDALLGANGQQPLYAMTRIKENQAQADHARRLQEMAQEWQYRNSQPDYATVGNRRFAYNPATGESQTLYVAPSAAQDYAAALGAEPGTPEYETLVSDYVLRHSGPTATANAMMEENNRQENRVGLEGIRQQNRIGIEGVRQDNRMSLRGMPTYRDTHPRPATGRGGGSKGAPGAVREGQTATNPATGEKVVYRGGKWIPAK